MDQEELELILAELERRKADEKCQWFVPNGKQQEFIQQVGSDKKFILLYVGANGVGKTALLANILANVCYGPQNEYFRGLPIFDNFPYPKRIRIGTESKNVEAIGSIDTEIQTWWPKGRYEGFKNGKLYTSLYKTDTGFLIDKMSFEQETKEWESSTLGMAVFDEPPPKDKFAATVSRMRKGGLIVFFMTPLLNAAWIKDELVDKEDIKNHVTFADIEDNCKEHGIRGILEHSHIQQMIENMDPDEIEARAHGKFMHLANSIFGKAFRRDWHLVSNDLKAPEGAQWGYTIDPAGSKPFAITFWWVDRRGNIVIDDEYPREDFTKMKESKLQLPDYVDMLKTWEMGKTVNKRIIDRHFANARDYRGKTLMDELEEAFGTCTWENSYSMDKEIESGILKIKSYLKFDHTSPVTSINQPRLLVKARCFNTIRGLERWSNVVTDKGVVKPDESSPYKDHVDCIRYTLMSNPEVYTPKPFSPRKPRYSPGR